jgi:hypothetical protein
MPPKIKLFEALCGLYANISAKGGYICLIFGF